MPSVSVIIPTYNRAALVATAIDSVLAQTFTDREIIVVDDGSTDDTTAALARYGDRIRVLRQDNRGVGAARNAGIAAAGGEYVAFLDSDDVWLPAKLARQMDLLRRRPELDWAYCDAFAFRDDPARPLWRLSEQVRPHEGLILRPLLRDCFIYSPTPVIRRTALNDAGGFEPLPGASVEDWDLWLRLATRHPAGYVAEALAGYRLHAGSATQVEEKTPLIEAHLEILEHVRNFAPDIVGPLYPAARAFHLRALARHLAGRGQASEARRRLREALRLQPLNPAAWFLWTLAAFDGRMAVWLHRWNLRRRQRRFPGGV